MNKLSIKNYTIEPWNKKYSSYDVQLNKLTIHPSWNDFFKNEITNSLSSAIANNEILFQNKTKKTQYKTLSICAKFN